MKIKSLFKKNINVPFKKKDGKTVTVTLRPGQHTFSPEKEPTSHQIKVYNKKGYLNITEGSAGKDQENYKAYDELPNIIRLDPLELITTPVSDDENDFPEETISPVSIEDEDMEDEGDEGSMDDIDTFSLIDEVFIEIEDEEIPFINDDNDKISIPKKKKKSGAGRPKGAKNKSKSDKPTATKRTGRPKKTPDKPKNDENTSLQS